MACHFAKFQLARQCGVLSGCKRAVSLRRCRAPQQALSWTKQQGTEAVHDMCRRMPPNARAPPGGDPAAAPPTACSPRWHDAIALRQHTCTLQFGTAVQASEFSGTEMQCRRTSARTPVTASAGQQRASPPGRAFVVAVISVAALRRVEGQLAKGRESLRV